MNPRSDPDQGEPSAAGGRVRPALESVIRALRRVNLEGSVFGQSVAIRLGLSDSDVEALETLLDTGAATAGRLGELMGLTTGAVTRLVDRLEQAGYVRRVTDPADRRRVIIEVVPEKVTALEAMLASIGNAGAEAVARYSDAQLELIGDFLARMADITRSEASRLRTSAEPAAGGPSQGEHAAPLGGVTSGRLVLRPGASEVRFDASPDIGRLYRARFEGVVPKVVARDGTVSITYRSSFFDWRKRTADVTLNATIPWTIAVQGGASKVSADLRRLDLRGFELSGGASSVRLSIGRPVGEVPIRIVGGAAAVRLDRPAGVGLRIVVSGGYGQIDVDGSRLYGRSGHSVLDTPGSETASERFLVEIVGGMGKISVEKRAGG